MSCTHGFGPWWKHARWRSAGLLSLAALSTAFSAVAAEVRILPPPPARVSVHVDTVHGVEVRDPYRWMEETTGAEFIAWAAAQQRHTEAVLGQGGEQDRLRDLIAATLQAAPTLGAVNPTAGTVLVTRWLPDGQTLSARDDGTDAERTLLTQAMLKDAGRGTRIRNVSPSWDGRHAAITSTGRGDKAPQVSIIDLRTGKLLPDHITDLLTTTSGSRYQVAWLPDSSGFIYPRLSATALTGPGAEMYARGRQYLHRIGSPVSEDVPVFGHDTDAAIPMDIEDLPSAVVMAPGSPWIVARLARVKHDTAELWAARLADVLAGDARWRRVSDDGHGSPALRGSQLYALTSDGADRRRIVARDLDDEGGTWNPIVAERTGVIRSFVLAKDDLYFTELRDGRDWLYRSSVDGGAADDIAVPLAGSLRLTAATNRRDGITLEAANWVDPGDWFRVAPGARVATSAGLAAGGAMPATDDLLVEERTFPADDGIPIPVSIVRSRTRPLDGTSPLLLEAYGSFGKIQAPEFNPFIALWVREGGTFAYAHVRGGGELGEAWHRAALRETKSTTTSDLIAVAQGLVERGYTTARKTILLGTSNGAQPAGMALAQRPGQFGVVVYNVGQPDDLRGAQHDPTSARNLGELGDTQTAEGVALLVRNSPYYQLPDALELPAVVVKSAPDDYNYGSAATTAKYVARLQAANRGDRPVLWLHQPGGHSWLFDGDPEQDARLMAWLLSQTKGSP